jgi:hypothetical protein
MKHDALSIIDLITFSILYSSKNKDEANLKMESGLLKLVASPVPLFLYLHSFSPDKKKFICRGISGNKTDKRFTFSSFADGRWIAIDAGGG